MHRQLRKYLSTATGESDLVVVIFLDVRGFSSFARLAESSEAALFLRSIYTQILDGYFPDAAFFKPTGDGLMVIQHFSDDTLEQVTFDSIRAALRLVGDFPKLTSADPMVNFEVPQDLGVGIARGAATRLVSGRVTLDYSGRPLNLAARLMDLARPRGVVVDGQTLKALDLPSDLAKGFAAHQVFVRGINDAKARPVLGSHDVRVRQANKHPLVGRPHEDDSEALTFKEFQARGRFIHVPDREPVDPDLMRLLYEYPHAGEDGELDQSMFHVNSMDPVEVERTPRGWQATFDYEPVTKLLQNSGVRSEWQIELRLAYAVTSGDE